MPVTIARLADVRGASPARWFAIGLIAGPILIALQVAHMGGNPGDLLAGGHHELGAWVEDRLGSDLNELYEHDGHRYYAVAEDLAGHTVPALMPDPAYRYQRILFPVLASFGGLLNGRPVMWSMIGWSILAFAGSAAAVSSLADHFRLPGLTPLVVVANPAVWLGLQLLTADTLALGLFCWGLVALLKGRFWPAVSLFALACLTKEVYVAAVGALAVMTWTTDRSRSRWLFTAVTPTVLWFVILQLRFGSAASDVAALSPPLVGLIQGLSAWHLAGGQDVLFGVLAMGIVAGGVAVLRHHRRLWAWLCAPWLIVALISSRWVWSLANNALRVLAPLSVFVVLAALDRQAETRSS